MQTMSAAPDLTRWITEIRERLDRIEGMLSPPANDTGETLDEWELRYRISRKARGHMADRDSGRYRRWIAPRLGARSVATLTSAELVEWVDWIEEQAAEGVLRATTAWRVWTVLSSMMRAAYSARDRSLRVRTDNTLRDVRGPARGASRVGTFLYPSEFLRLVSCRRVPLESRRRYALSVYLYPRAGELEALRWSDVDMRTGRIHVHRARKSDGSIGETKTGEDRQWVAERAVLPLLRAMRREARSELVCSGRTSSVVLRTHLERTGCTREDLFADDERRRPITMHDLRATGITWQAMRGDSPTIISERVGHMHLATTERYIRRGRLMVTGRGERVFPELPDRLLGRRSRPEVKIFL